MLGVQSLDEVVFHARLRDGRLLAVSWLLRTGTYVRWWCCPGITRQPNRARSEVKRLNGCTHQQVGEVSALVQHFIECGFDLY